MGFLFGEGGLFGPGGSLGGLFLHLRLNEEEESVNLEGKVAIVTGSNTGIGYHLAKFLYQRGAFVILACRSSSKALAAKESILSSTYKPNPTAGVEYWNLDLGKLESVREFAERWKSEMSDRDGGKLDLLCLNAGALFLERTVTDDGFEGNYQINYLSHFLLTLLLLSYLAKSPSPRVIYTGSRAVCNPTFKLTEKNFRGMVNQNYSWWNWYFRWFNDYCMSKRLQYMGIKQLDSLLLSTTNPSYRRIIIHTVHPGMVNSDLMYKDLFNIPNWFLWLMQVALGKMARTPEEAAVTLIRTAVGSKAGEGIKEGKENMRARFWQDGIIIEENKFPKECFDEELRRRIWHLTTQDAGINDPVF